MVIKNVGVFVLSTRVRIIGRHISWATWRPAGRPGDVRLDAISSSSMAWNLERGNVYTNDESNRTAAGGGAGYGRAQRQRWRPPPAAAAAYLTHMNVSLFIARTRHAYSTTLVST